MRASRPGALVLALAACSLPVYDDSATATTSTTGAGPTASSTSTTREPTSSAATGNSSGQSFIPFPDAGPKDCDVWTEDCPEGQKCTPYSGDGDNSWDSLKCVPVVPDPHQVGEPCTVTGSAVSGEDNCDKHMMCWDVDSKTNTGTCVAMCIGTPDESSCPDPLTGCLVANDAVLTLCLPQCDPIAQDCDFSGDMCIPEPGDLDNFICVPQARTEGLFDPCEFVNGCDRGQACADSALAVECDQAIDGCCLPFCDLDEPNTCPGAGQQCVAWYADPADAAPFNVDVGLCALP